MSDLFGFRIRLISFFILCIAVVFGVKLFYLQILRNQDYLTQADRQYITPEGSQFDRGSIFFKKKNGETVSAASLLHGFTVAINPTILKNPEEVYEKIKDIVSISKDDFILKATKKNDPYEVIENRVSYENGKKIEELKIKGLDIYTERWRFYPGKQLASNVLGFMGFDSGGTNFVGRYGLERQYETNLSRKNSSYQNFFAQIFSNIKNDDGIKNEANVITSIEPTVQSFLEDELSKVNKTYSSEYSLGMIINPKNGEIYAMASSPSFDPNNIKDEKDPAIFKNPLVENVYEMGSIIKVLTVASGIDTGVITASTTYNDQGFIFLNNKKISNFDGKAKGIVDIQTALSQSLNVGMAFIVSRVGNERFSEYLYNFGLAEKTKIDLPNEAKNLVENLKSKRDIEHATASFGLTQSAGLWNCLVAGDLDGDGLADAAVARFTDSAVSVFRGLPGGGLASEASSVALKGSHPNGMAIGKLGASLRLVAADRDSDHAEIVSWAPAGLSSSAAILVPDVAGNTATYGPVEAAIGDKVVTYDFARLMEGAKEVKCSAFGQAMIDRM
jgi:cell division protein FtsI/penicillin-binding protein 2